MFDTPLLVKASPSYYFGGRWGDYASMSIDPTDDCTFWFSTQYVAKNGDWTTEVVPAKFATCQ